MLLLTRRKFIQLTPAGAIAFWAGCKGPISPISDVKEYVVELVTSAGEVIQEKAGTLAEALRRAWRGVFGEWDGDVEVDPDNQLKGTLHGSFLTSVVIKREGDREDKMTSTLTNPPVSRRSVDGPWEVDPSVYPPGFLTHMEQ